MGARRPGCDPFTCALSILPRPGWRRLPTQAKLLERPALLPQKSRAQWATYRISSARPGPLGWLDEENQKRKESGGGNEGAGSWMPGNQSNRDARLVMSRLRVDHVTHIRRVAGGFKQG